MGSRLDESAWPENAAPSTADLDGCSVIDPPTWPVSTCTPRWRRRRLRRLVPELAELAAAAGFTAQQPLAGDAHHLVRAAARDRLTDAQLAEARGAALAAVAAGRHRRGARMRRPGNRRARRLGAAAWARSRRRGDRLLGRGGDHTRTGARAGGRNRGPWAGRGPLRRRSARSHTAWLHEPYTDAPGTRRHLLPRPGRDRRATCGRAPRPGLPPAFTSSAMPRSRPWLRLRARRPRGRWAEVAVARSGPRQQRPVSSTTRSKAATTAETAASPMT